MSKIQWLRQIQDEGMLPDDPDDPLVEQGQPMTPIDLSTAKPGDVFVDGYGCRMIFVGPSCFDDFLFSLRDVNSIGRGFGVIYSFTRNGKFGSPNPLFNLVSKETP